MFPFYTRVNVLFLPCKTSGPVMVNRNKKMRNSRYYRNVPSRIWEQPTKLKISEKTSQRLNENSIKAQVKRLGEMKTIFEIW